jgi:DNA-binding transcriptional ArsR family regulator
VRLAGATFLPYFHLKQPKADESLRSGWQSRPWVEERFCLARGGSRILNDTVKYSEAALDATFGALADPTRRAIMAQLARGESSVTELASKFDISLPGVAKHLRVLEGAGLMRSTKQGRVRRCRLAPGPMKDAADWLRRCQQFWEDQLDALEAYLKEAQSNEEEKPWSQRREPAPKPPSESRQRSPRRSPARTPDTWSD